MMAEHARPLGGWQYRVIAGALFSLLATATSASAQNTFPSTGNVGIGTTTPAAPLTIRSTPGAEAIRVLGRLNGGVDEANIMLFKNDGSAFHGAITGANGSLNLQGGSSGVAVTVTNSRNVGIGTTNPTSMLHVTGDVRVDGNISAKYQDVAEWVPARPGLGNGTVLVVDRNKDNHVLPSATPYDTGVAGVVSTQPGILLGEPGSEKVKVAHNGRVRVKVDARQGGIKIGDLLVTSSTPGYAMRSVPVNIGGTVIHRPGTILGKALEALEGGQGEILVLLTLQ